MQKAKSEFKQLKSLVEAANKKELTEKFDKMGVDLIESVQNYIIANDYDEPMRFTQIKEL